LDKYYNELVWEAKQNAVNDFLQKLLLEKLNFAARFEYGPVQRTIIELILAKMSKLGK